MTKEQIEYIKHYGDRIKDIPSFIEGVRKLPGFYIGDKGNLGWKACFREIFQNAVDESLRPLSPCHYIKVTFDEATQTALIEDTGSGIPHGKIIHIYTTERSSANYEKNAGEYTSGAHGVGSGVAMALSEHFEVTSYILGKAKHVEFNNGEPWKKGEEDIQCPDGRQGTTVLMSPDRSILGMVNLTCQEIYDLIIKIIPIMNRGDRVDFIGYDINHNLIFDKKLINTDGPITGLYMICKNPIVTPISFIEDTGKMKAEIYMTYDSGDMDAFADILSYANFTPTTENGTHVDGFLSGLTKWFLKYINTFYLAKNSKITVKAVDIKTGLKAVVNADHLYPVFKGQYKGKLSNEDMFIFVEQLTLKSLDQWSKTNPGDLQKVCKFIKEIAELRSKTDDSKIKLSNQYEKSSLSGDPKKYVKPSDKKDLELFIVEGDSALGAAKQARDPKHQGLFPIRGKLINAFSTPKAKFMQNPEVAAIIKLVSGDGSYGRNLDIEKVKWDKIVFMTDADPDGDHIKSLLLRMFLLYMPQIIEAGKLYAAVPPLFGMKRGKHMQYFTDMQEMAKFSQSLFSKQYSLTTLNNKPITQKELVKIFYNNMDYATDMRVLSSILATDPMLLETVLFELARVIDFNVESHVAMAMAQSKTNKAIKEQNKTKDTEEADSSVRTLIDGSINKAVSYTLLNLDFKNFRSYMEKKYRFIKVHMKNGIIVVEGLLNDKYQDLVLNEHTIKLSLDMIRKITANEIWYFKMNGNPVTLYNVMSTLDSILPNDIKRYKGLGEQDANELWESTMCPESRTLVRYTIASAKEEIESIRFIDSNRSSLLNGITVTRQDIE